MAVNQVTVDILTNEINPEVRISPSMHHVRVPVPDIQVEPAHQINPEARVLPPMQHIRVPIPDVEVEPTHQHHETRVNPSMQHVPIPALIPIFQVESSNRMISEPRVHQSEQHARQQIAHRCREAALARFSPAGMNVIQFAGRYDVNAGSQVHGQQQNLDRVEAEPQVDGQLQNLERDVEVEPQVDGQQQNPERGMEAGIQIDGQEQHLERDVLARPQVDGQQQNLDLDVVSQV